MTHLKLAADFFAALVPVVPTPRPQIAPTTKPAAPKKDTPR